MAKNGVSRRRRNNVTAENLLAEITEAYLKSSDFNGVPARQIDLSKDRLHELVSALVSLGLASINFGDLHPNPHVLAFEPEPAAVQLEKLVKLGLAEACLYPTRKHLAKVVDPSAYTGEPFKLEMALGGPQLSHRSFDLAVLEAYRNDPRYHYQCDDISGTIGVTSTASSQGQIRAADKVFLQTFGFSYDENMNRAVAVYLRYLRGLTPEHQQIWRAKLLAGNFELHPEYHRMTMGHWPEGGSLFSAFLTEQSLINEMSGLIGRVPFFRNVFSDSDRPKAFGFLVRPTLREFNDFVQLLDKLLSDNIDSRFFEEDVSAEEETTRKDGKIVVRRKGSIRLLGDWLKGMVQVPDPKPRDKMLGVFKKIRGMRQRPAHAVHEDVFDQKYFKEQRQLMMDAYNAVRILRMMLQSHPAARSCQIPDWLRLGKIWTR